MDWLNRFDTAPSIEIDGQVVPIAIKRHPTAKRLTMRVAPDGSEIRVTMPRWGQSREAAAFAKSRLPWLAKQLQAIGPVQTIQPGAMLPFRGGEYQVTWDEKLPRRPDLANGLLQIGGPEGSVAKRLERWLRVEAQSLMEQDLARYCALSGVAAPPIKLSRAQRRWGSCSSSGTVRINWRLVMAPDAIRQSVVAHEVAHLTHFDHSRAFYALLDRIFDGDLPAANGWLKQHGRSLYRHFG